jgi:hypothetical protein
MLTSSSDYSAMLQDECSRLYNKACILRQESAALCLSLRRSMDTSSRCIDESRRLIAESRQLIAESRPETGVIAPWTAPA